MKFQFTMSNKYKFRDQDKLYFVTFAVINWIDLFIRNEYKEVMLDSWRYCMANKGLEIYGWCIMTSHVHMIIGTHGEKMEDILRDMKRHTAEKLRDVIRFHAGESRKEWLLELMHSAGNLNSNNRGFQLWQQDNHPIELPTESIKHQKLDYIHHNPVVAGFVEKPEDYVYSSASNYYIGRGLIEITLLDPILR